MTRRPVRVHVLALPRCTPIVPIGVMDLLRKSTVLGAGTRGLELTLVSAARTREIEAAGGIRLVCDRTIARAPAPDVAVVPALDPDILERIGENAAVIRWLGRAHRAGTLIASACTGAFLLGEAGLLDGRTATTHWAFQGLFAARYPRARVAAEAILVDQGRLITSGGATSFINLVHYLVERLLGPATARAASRMFLIDPSKAPQSAYAALATQKEHGDDAVLRAQEIIEAESATATVEELARRVALSPRSLTRRFREATGSSPRDYVQRVRVEAAKQALEGGAAIAAVARQVGYSDPVAFRKTFTRVTGLTPADYRARYGPRAAPSWVGPTQSRAR